MGICPLKFLVGWKGGGGIGDGRGRGEARRGEGDLLRVRQSRQVDQLVI